jgi:hypothetical protein
LLLGTTTTSCTSSVCPAFGGVSAGVRNADGCEPFSDVRYSACVGTCVSLLALVFFAGFGSFSFYIDGK